MATHSERLGLGSGARRVRRPGLPPSRAALRRTAVALAEAVRPGTGAASKDAAYINKDDGAERRGTENALLCSPFITQSLAAGATFGPPGIEMAGGGGPMVLRLVRQDFYHQAWQGKTQNLRSRGPGNRLGSHECSITSSKQKLRVNKSS